MSDTSRLFQGNEIVGSTPFFQHIYNTFTYELWVKPTAKIQLQRQSSQGTSGVIGQKYVLAPAYVAEKNCACVGVSVGTNGIAVYEHGADYLPPLLVYPCNLSDWTHIAIVYKNKVSYLYVNGQLKRMGLRSSRHKVYAAGMIGGFKPYGFYSGYVRGVMLWEYARTTVQIQKGMTANAALKRGEGAIDLLEQPGTLQSLSTKRKLTVLFVRSGWGFPYPPLEDAIIQALQQLVQRVEVTSLKQDVMQAVQGYNPDLVLVFHGGDAYPPRMAHHKALKQSSVKTALWLTDDPYYLDVTKKYALYYDFIFTQEENCVSFYKKLGSQHVYYLPLAADTAIFYPREVAPQYKKDILFVGTAYEYRLKIFDQLAGFLANQDVLISGKNWDKLKNYELLKSKIRLNHWMTAEETANYYNGAKIVLNIHRPHDDQTLGLMNEERIVASSPNPRMFEVLACKSFLLTDYREGLNKLYVPDRDVAVFTTPEELRKSLVYYLRNDAVRNEMALHAYQKTKNTHTFLQRVSALLDTVFP